MPLFDFDLQTFTVNLVKLLIAFFVTLPVAWEREIESRSMGLRTFPLVAMASCAFVLVGASVMGLEDFDAQGRLLQGLMTGIGFIGGGAIVKDGGSVSGAATAASIWGTGVIGAAVGYDRLEIAVLVSLLTFFLLRGLGPVKGRIQEMNDPDELS